jgi:hypothetical protein
MFELQTSEIFRIFKTNLKLSRKPKKLWFRIQADVPTPNFRINLLLPILKPEYVAKRIVDAVLTDQPELIMPKFLYFAKALSRL